MTLNKIILMARTKKNTKVVEQPEPIVETVEAVETETQNETATDNNRVEYSLETHYRELIRSIDTRRRDDLVLKKSLKKFVERTNRAVVRSAKTKKASNPGKKRATGFGDKTPLPPEFAKLFNMTEETVPRTDISKHLHKFLDEHGLKDKKDRRIHRVNDAIQEAFHLTDAQVKYMNNVDSPKDKEGFNFYNVQNFIKTVYDRMGSSTTQVQETVETQPVVQVEEKVVQEKPSKKRSSKK
jgi:hypothetical protein